MPLPYTLPFTLGLGSGELLEFFAVSGHFLDVENPPLVGASTQPAVNTMTGTVTFYPRLPLGSVLYLSDFNLAQSADGALGTAATAIALATIEAQIVGGVLQTIDSDNAPTIQLMSCTPTISAALIAQGYNTEGQLIYDVQFSDIMYSATPQQITNFAFAAPDDNTPISITSATLTRLPYVGPKSH